MAASTPHAFHPGFPTQVERLVPSRPQQDHIDVVRGIYGNDLCLAYEQRRSQPNSQATCQGTPRPSARPRKYLGPPLRPQPTSLHRLVPSRTLLALFLTLSLPRCAIHEAFRLRCLGKCYSRLSARLALLGYVNSQPLRRRIHYKLTGKMLSFRRSPGSGPLPRSE